ncbi:MAG: radical SAM protein [Thermoplasmata archaeon]|nr:MAG: radical SAM protein [Thermoplasmata archaeon]
MRILQRDCKTALNPSKLPGIDYALNPYRGCSHACIYCYVPDVIKIDRSTWGSFVEVKRNLPLVLSKELKHKKPGVVGISTVTDPYQPVEKEFNITRYSLEQLLQYDFPVSIQTKSSLVERDLSLISSFSDIEVMFSIATLNEDEKKLLEPFSSSIKDRLKALKLFSEIGVKTSIFFGPMYPTIKIEDIPHILDVFKSTGISYVMIDKFRMKPGLWDYMSLKLRENSEVYRLFSKNLFSNYYETLRRYIFKIGEKKKIKIVDAF